MSLPETLVILTADCTVTVKTVRIRVSEGEVCKGVAIQVEKLAPSLILSPEMSSTGRNWVGHRSLGVSGGSIARLMIPDMGMVYIPV